MRENKMKNIGKQLKEIQEKLWADEAIKRAEEKRRRKGQRRLKNGIIPRARKKR